MSLEDHYRPEKEHLFESLENIAKQLNGDEFYRAIYIFQDEMALRNREDEQEKHIEELLQYSHSFEEFFSKSKTSFLESVRHLNKEFLRERWDAKEQTVKTAF